jgi:hypothetical protein
MTLRAFRHFETTPPLVHRCRRCAQPVIYGLAEGIPARTDVHPIDAAAEAAAVAAGRQTYTLTRPGLVHRDETRRTDPLLASPVLVEHTCPRRNR